MVIYYNKSASAWHSPQTDCKKTSVLTYVRLDVYRLKCYDAMFN